MLNRIPTERKSAEIYLDQERGRLFPEYFYSFLQSYLQIFSSIPIIPADDKIMRLHADITNKQIINILTENFGTYEDGEDKVEENGWILMTTVVTSCIRGLHHCSSKLCSLEILQQLAEYTSSDTILDRILPYIVSILLSYVTLCVVFKTYYVMLLCKVLLRCA